MRLSPAGAAQQLLEKSSLFMVLAVLWTRYHSCCQSFRADWPLLSLGPFILARPANAPRLLFELEQAFQWWNEQIVCPGATLPNSRFAPPWTAPSSFCRAYLPPLTPWMRGSRYSELM
ncbi:hypothetical protein GALMADRAFT_1048568 [Galerina marginata CBS 339.88]|uniref:Uncharacterized protein n=1 Tax=Galerina marginata (strain CBS 339.88) TaxID=685588 RepID=A0A067SKG5_GALM3|nr:hypothetical protein GALMADRAFT_1048568 [Galerina marginata CBS 339.88]